MEDEDSESKVVDALHPLERQQQLKDASVGNSLESAIDNTYTAVFEEEKQLLEYNSIAKDSSSRNNSTGSKIVFKGYKKRILAQAQETQTNTSKSTVQEHSTALLKSNKRTEIKQGEKNVFVRRLGLRPSSKKECSKCQPLNSCSTLKQSSCSCNSAMTLVPNTSESPKANRTNFKTTRKVYLCAACGTYFENWNLFIHLRNVHKRYLCLFCLGLFEEADRLLQHLQRHGLPEMSFTSIEDFYGAFKGPCYLVCCTCEKVFAETDNFYDHLCSPAPKQNATSTCSVAAETSKETNPVTSTASQGGLTPNTKPLDKGVISGSKSVSRKLVRNNRSKHVEDGVLSQKASSHAKKANNKITLESNESQVSDEAINRDENCQNEATHNVVKDTVSETIMEVSKYVEDSCDEKEKTNEDVTCRNDSESNLFDAPSHSMPYDSITETIMEVSQCTNNLEETSNERNKEEDSGVTDGLDTSEKSETAKPDPETLNSTEDSNTRRDNLDCVNEKTEEKEVSKKETEETTNFDEDDSHSHASGSPAHSPEIRSLFSPHHESNLPNEQSKETDSCENENEKENVNVINESRDRTSVSYTTSETSDRSLVIKICTNRNSQFSVTSNSGIIENDIHEDKSEGNNADSSLTEKESDSIFEGEGGENSNANDEDSDSDSFKLAVVDNDGAEEAEEKNNEWPKIESNENNENKENENRTEDGKSTIDIIDDTNEKQTGDDDTKDESETRLEDSARSETRNDGIVLAGEDVTSIDLNVDGTLDSIEIEDLLKRCIGAASPSCVFCNHARHIAVNGKQLGLHMLAEHKFQPQHPAIIIQPEQFVTRVKKSLDELDLNLFNLDSYSTSSGTYNVPDTRTYECFHCRFHSTVHKELYLHNRKMHQKTILVCVMCKSTFYSYSELLCHLCPGIYSPNINVKYRCCLCPRANLPSAFRLMVHLRKKHHACDVCLESTGNQQRLSNHVWKHKLHHLCYRCGIAYRNKPDITKHLFWKHGTESVLCKKCLQKKWPHVYHFCIPPTAFVCEECGSSFSQAVALKVHKRIHSGDSPYACNECSERFISRKLLKKHEDAHREPPPTPVTIGNSLETTSNGQQSANDRDQEKSDKEVGIEIGAAPFDSAKETKEPPVKKVVDVYDLPPLNLSSESDTDPEDEKPAEIKESKSNDESIKPVEEKGTEENDQSKSVPAEPVTDDNIVEVEQKEEEQEQAAQIMDGIWDNFKTYTASLGIKESVNNNFKDLEPEPETDVAFLRSIVLADHDYCIVWSKDKAVQELKSNEKENETTGDKGYSNKTENGLNIDDSTHGNRQDDSSKKKSKSPKKKKQTGSTSSSDSSSDSDSSSCSCKTNCSCSSSSSGSSSSSSSSSDSDSSSNSEGSRSKKQIRRKERKKEKESGVQEPEPEIDVENKPETIPETENGTIHPEEPIQIALRESDLETEETETDEDFYDEHPQQLANQLLAEKRNQLMLLAAVAPASTDSSAIPLNNGLTDTDTAIPSPDPTTLTVEEDQTQQKRKQKTKKRKKGERSKQRNATPTIESIKLNIPKAFYQKLPAYSTTAATMMPLDDTQTTVSVVQQPVEATGQHTPSTNAAPGQQGNKRSSKRKRVPKRFYGDSTDDESEKQPTSKWRKVPETPLQSFAPLPSVKSLPPRLPFGGKNLYRPTESHRSLMENVTIAAASATESEEPADTSSDSSDSEREVNDMRIQTRPTDGNATMPERPVNVYCYCRCPYDEVSEMIACDAEDCRIEWFHFECVGIMVPPKGKWYCPDCRKKHNIIQNEDYFE